MQTSDNGVAFIAGNEGYMPIPKPDTGGNLVWGHGHDRVGQEPVPASITLPDADALLRTDLTTRFDPAVNRHVPANCTQNQFDAMADFCYEFGEGGLQQLLAHGWEQVTTQLPRWCHAEVNGTLVELAGLVARRQKEITLFNT
jgi:GH24 family phage-related lysozyme (muramidase)